MEDPKVHNEIIYGVSITEKRSPKEHAEEETGRSDH